MKNNETDIDEGIDFSEKAFKKRFKRIPRPKHLENLPKNAALRDCKSRITICLDADIVSYFKELAENSDAGYQTLINQSLREIVDGQRQTQSSNIKQDILQDRQFLQELKQALET